MVYFKGGGGKNFQGLYFGTQHLHDFQLHIFGAGAEHRNNYSTGIQFGIKGAAHRDIYSPKE